MSVKLGNNINVYIFFSAPVYVHTFSLTDVVV